MNAVSGTILVTLLLVVCFAPRRWALLAMMAGVFFLTQGHSVSVAGLNIYPIRFLAAVAFGRVLARRELAWSRLNKIDWTLLLLYNYAALIWILRSPDVTPQQFAAGVDPTLGYLALRALVGSLEDLRWFLNAFVVLLIPFTLLVFVERLTAQSPFIIVGAESQLLFRNEVARCQGSFRHAILLGSVAASFFSLYIGLWLTGTRRAVALLGGVACLALVILANSGGPLTSTATALLGWSVWSVRDRMFLVRRAVIGMVLFLLLFMKAPIWYLPYKISGIVGGGGYHRGLLMDQAWQELHKWWLTGMDIKDTASWLPYVHELFGGADVTNQYLLFGIRAGLPAIMLCVILLAFAFKNLGQALSPRRLSDERGRADDLLLWGLGVAVLVHAVSWWGVAYFDQSYVVWLMHIAALSGAAQRVTLGAREDTSILVTATPAWLSSRRANASIRELRRAGATRRQNCNQKYASVAVRHRSTKRPHGH
jgi:hypothetical protein